MTSGAHATGAALGGPPAPAACRAVIKESGSGLAPPHAAFRVSIADCYFAEEVRRLLGEQDSTACLMQNRSRHISDTSSTQSCDSCGSSQSNFSSDSAASGAHTERAGARHVMLVAENGRTLSLAGDVAGQERSFWPDKSASSASLHPMLRAEVFAEFAESRAPPNSRRMSSPASLGFEEGARRPSKHFHWKHSPRLDGPVMKQAGNLDAVLCQLDRDSRAPEEQVVAALVGGRTDSSEESTPEGESGADQAWLLYTDAAHLVGK